MTWDLALDARTHDMTGGIVTGRDEIIQRLKIRLWRHLGEWFLATGAGLPWYTAGRKGAKSGAILGSRDRTAAELRIRRETLETDGVQRVLSLHARSSGREFGVYMEIMLEDGTSEAITLTMNEE
ncbi:MAG: hypothetical protein LIP28_09605 [Deltaproteobacteria bacterium]|nr:hypothetical protein [Deltaproteobacteria bacterium]